MGAGVGPGDGVADGESALNVARMLLRDGGVRAEVDLRDDKMGAKIRDAELEKIPYMLVVGRREAELGTVAVNVRGAGKEQKPNSIALDEFVGRVVRENASRTLTLAAHADTPPV